MLWRVFGVKIENLIRKLKFLFDYSYTLLGYWNIYGFNSNSIFPIQLCSFSIQTWSPLFQKCFSANQTFSRFIQTCYCAFQISNLAIQNSQFSPQVKMLSIYSSMQFFTANLQFANSNTLFDKSSRLFVYRNMQSFILKQLFCNSIQTLYSSIQTDNSSIPTRDLLAPTYSSTMETSGRLIS